MVTERKPYLPPGRGRGGLHPDNFLLKLAQQVDEDDRVLGPGQDVARSYWEKVKGPTARPVTQMLPPEEELPPVEEPPEEKRPFLPAGQGLGGKFPAQLFQRPYLPSGAGMGG